MWFDFSCLRGWLDVRCGWPLVTVPVVVVSTPLIAQAPLRDSRLFRSAIELTSITATVRDGDGRLVTGLERDAFEVFEDGVRQQVTQFTSERVPVSLALLLDVSDSMYGRRIQDARAAVAGFLIDLLDPADEFLVLAFNHQPYFLSKWSRDRSVVRGLLDAVRPTGGTAVYDAILSVVPQFASRGNQRAAVVLISDGADTASDATLRDVRGALLRTDAFAYAVAIDSPGSAAINTRVNPLSLQEITDTSGGRTEVVRGSEELAAAVARIADELNHQYLLGYSPPHAADGKFHSIRVRVTGAEYRVRARNGYVATK